MRPEYPSIVYTQILKKLYPDVPVILGGIEASLRRVTHYDYWQDCVQKSILIDSGADLLIYGMGEKPITELCRRMKALTAAAGQTHGSAPIAAGLPVPHDILQTAYIIRKGDPVCPLQNISTSSEHSKEKPDIILHSHEECLKDKKKQAENFRFIEEESNKYEASPHPAGCGKQDRSGQSSLPSHDTGRTGYVFRLAIHPAAPSQIQRETHPGL